MNPNLIFITKILATIILGSVWGYLTLFPIPHSDTIFTGILPILGALIQNLTKGLNNDASKSDASISGAKTAGQLNGESK